MTEDDQVTIKNERPATPQEIEGAKIEYSKKLLAILSHPLFPKEFLGVFESRGSI